MLWTAPLRGAPYAPDQPQDTVAVGATAQILYGRKELVSRQLQAQGQVERELSLNAQAMATVAVPTGAAATLRSASSHFSWME